MQMTKSGIQDDTTPLRFAGQLTPVKPVGPARLPDFLIIGACKAGTTTLWKYLQRHPQIGMLDPKEPEFFSKSEHYSKGIDWYKRLFAAIPEGVVCGEASTTYSRHPHFGDVPSRIYAHAPNVRLIYMLRHPVERTYSHYQHRMRLNVPRMTFEEALESDPMFLDSSLYLMQMEQYLARFDRSQLLPVLLDDLSADPERTLRMIQDFLGVEPKSLSESGALASNRADSAGGADYVRQRIRRVAHAAPGVKWVLRKLPTSMKDGVLNAVTRSKLGASMQRGYRPSPLLPETRERLIERFAEPNRELGRFLGRDLSHWST